MKSFIACVSVCLGMAALGCAVEPADETQIGDDIAVGEAASAVDGECGTTILFEDDFSSASSGWSMEAGWQMGVAKSSSCQGMGSPDPATDHTPTSDNRLVGVFIGGCPSVTTSSPDYFMTSPVINADVSGSVTLSFARWLNTSYRNRSRIDVFDGSTWVNIWESPATVADSSWTDISFDLTPYKNANLRVRFGYRSTISFGGWVMSSWNIDDVRVADDTCQ